MDQTSAHRRDRHRAWAAGTLLAIASITPGSRDVPTARAPIEAASPSATTRPHPLDNDIANVIVRVRGGTECSGTPLADTSYVVTAAHCVLDPDGNPGVRTVERDHVRYEAVAVLVDTAYVDHPSERLDAAVLVFDRTIPGPAARPGHSLPSHGTVTLGGYQPLDSDRTLLRGTNPSNRPLPKGATGTLVKIKSAPAGCEASVSELQTFSDKVSVACGLIPGASGGGLFASGPDGITLLGIVSTVNQDLTANGVTPVDSLQTLLTHPDTYFHDVEHHTDARLREYVRRS
jgi:Trypsin-like peptidase domain